MASSNVGQASPAFRFTDIGVLPKCMLAPIEGYESMPLVSLEDAVKPLVDIVPKIQRNVFVVKQNCEHPADGLTSDESASIMLYTFESIPHEHSLYVLLNTALRSERRQVLKPWFLYLRLVLTALARLPSERRFVNRGVKADLSADYPMGSTCIWWAFSSCTSSIHVLECDHFFGTTGTRTLFQIDCHTSKNIKNHSFIQNEDEILLLPARQFQVTSSLNSGNGLHIIQLQETQPTYALLEPVPLPDPITPSIKVPKVSTPVHHVKNEHAQIRQLIERCQENYIVDLQKQNVNDECIAVVVHLAIGKKKCAQLWLSRNSIDALGAAAIAAALIRNDTLMRLDLSYNRLSDKGVGALSKALAQNSSALRALFLTSNKITDEGARLIADMLKNNKGLRELILMENVIGDQGMKCLANALTHHNKTLTLLDLNTNKRIEDSTVDGFVRMLHHNRSLATLGISGNTLPKNGQETLENACTANGRCGLRTWHQIL